MSDMQGVAENRPVEAVGTPEIPIWPFCIAAIAGAFALPLTWSVLPLAALLAIVALRTPSAMRQILNPRYLLVGALIATAGGMLLGTRDLEIYGVAVSSEGLAIGARMLVRGLAVIASVACFSRSRAPALASALAGKVGLGRLVTATSEAFSLLPVFGDQLRTRFDVRRREGERRRALPRRLWRAALDLVVTAAETAEKLADRQRR